MMATKLSSTEPGPVYLHELENRQQLDNWLSKQTLRATGREDFWQDVLGYTVSAALLAIHLQPERTRPGQKTEFEMLVSALNDFNILANLISCIDAGASALHEDGSAYLNEVIDYWSVSSPELRARQYRHLLHLSSQKIQTLAASTLRSAG
ncbi:hypothetical protein H8F21_14610 [Pseudomonas sp. P66]|uniref:Uncharacterized protein n=1 Tax=Pseudomonas arcuscaelestis TaxID=2710591 RepID=A0ABS2BYW6_9PSED|nr:hypothetical protein [Pseudomonas arcuscaelestis]MBM5458797.1 hypothetical protein [Pseudomonas arcuscaelestis]